MTRVLIVDDDPADLHMTAEAARRAGYLPLTATSGRAAIAMLRADRAIAALIVDLVMPDLDGMAVLDVLEREAITVPVIIQTRGAATDAVAAATRRGAIDYFVKPVSPERLAMALANARHLDALEKALRALRNERQGTLSLSDVVAGSDSMARARTLIARAARSSIPVLIEGETGTGKRMAAGLIHGGSDRAGRPFVSVDLDQIPPRQMHAVLFGSSKPGAEAAGKVQQAQNGTLLIGNIGELTAEAQEAVLRLVETGEFARVGASRPERANVRVIATTERRLMKLAEAGSFRLDLYYRLNVLPIYLPPLRDRREEIGELARRFLARHMAETGKRVSGLGAAALEIFGRYDWPGNLAELENECYRALALNIGGELSPADFPRIVAALEGRARLVEMTAALPPPSAPVHIDAASTTRREREPNEQVPDRFVSDNGAIRPLEEVERDLIAFAIAHHAGRMSRVARALGIGRSTLYRKLKEYGLAEAVQSDAA